MKTVARDLIHSATQTSPATYRLNFTLRNLALTENREKLSVGWKQKAGRNIEFFHEAIAIDKVISGLRCQIKPKNTMHVTC